MPVDSTTTSSASETPLNDWDDPSDLFGEKMITRGILPKSFVINAQLALPVMLYDVPDAFLAYPIDMSRYSWKLSLSHARWPALVEPSVPILIADEAIQLFRCY